MRSGGEDEANLRCNGCWNVCDPKDHTVATQCGHLYCLNCCQTIIESDDPTCPICTQLIQKSNIKAVHVLGSSSDLQLVLAGQAPRVALEVAHSAIHFYIKQQALYAQYAQAQSDRKIARTHEQCKKKLQEVHAGYLNAKRKYQEVLAQKAALEAGNKELQDKYNQKAMQDKKLKEGFALLQQENEQLRRQTGMGGGPASGMAAVMSGGGLRASRGAMPGMEEGLHMRPATVMGHRAVPPDPSPVPSIGLGGFGPGSFVYDTPDPMPPVRGQLFTGGPGSAGGRISGARHMSGGPGAGRASNGLGGGRGGLSTQLHMGGVGRQSQQNDKRQSLGLAFPGGNHSTGTLGTM